jgi:hypothetical protein
VLIGLDLGQAADYSALAVLEQSQPAEGPRIYEITDLCRWPLHTDYTEVLRDVADRVTQIARTDRPVELVLDAGGCGRPVADMIRKARPPCFFVPVVITGGTHAAHQERGYWSVTKRDLASALMVLVHNNRLKVRRGLPEAQALVKEMRTFRVKVNPVTGHESFASASNKYHDDLVIAVALAAWRGERPRRELVVFA